MSTGKLTHSQVNTNITNQDTLIIFRQVQEYEAQVVELSEDLHQAGAGSVTLGELVPDSLTMARHKNYLL